ncbi:MAG: alkaline phosphatase PhoX [Pseudomonadota bacterium]|nr:alkaline phosphatase PhoX [Pseudomonadota bacterium]
MKNRLFKKSAIDNQMRRRLLKQGFASVFALSTGQMITGCGSDSHATVSPSNPDSSNLGNIGPLSDTPDANGFLLPSGFTSRVLAKTDTMPLNTSNYVWHDLPDGGATFATVEGGWIYVSNSEGSNGSGGVGALEFDSEGVLIDAFQLLNGTSKNCAGGLTPWDTWLSCEEVTDGMVWECYPLDRGDRAAVRRDAMGVFQHEAAATDPNTSIVYLTEDRMDGCLYRFIPDDYGDLSSGLLQAAVVDSLDAEGNALEGLVSWVNVQDPLAVNTSTRSQAIADGAAIFRRGEGAWFHDGVMYFATTATGADGGGNVWSLELGGDGELDTLTQIYNRTDLFPEDDSLNGIDNVTVSSGGDVLVAEDGDDMQVQAITPDGLLLPLFKLLGHEVLGYTGEIAGPAFDPSGTRLYFSSQRGVEADYLNSSKPIGVTYEISGPFVIS